MNDDYIKRYIIECPNCGRVSVQTAYVNKNQIETQKQMAYNKGYNEGYARAKREIREKLGI